VSDVSGELTALIRDIAKNVDDSSDWAPELWHTISELGLATIGIPEDVGGSGGSIKDLTVVIFELARAGIGTPIVEASTAAFVIGPPEPDSFDTVVVGSDVNLGAPTVTARLDGVPFGSEANRLVLVGDRDSAEVALAHEGVTIWVSTDVGGLPTGRVELDGAQLRSLPNAPEAPAIVERLTLGRAASLLGSCCGAYELTRRYVAERRQFGGPLIDIPAVASALAQMTVRIRHAESAVDRAIDLCVESDVPALRRLSAVASARVATADCATMVARTTHQLHGAVGVTREYGLHRYTRRIWAWRDADVSEASWLDCLGTMALAVDEDTLWNQVLA
jgi:acyl-CoA dehydrogenase